MPSYYPLFLNIEGRKCVVVGGGLVAERKVETLLECKASVTLISPQASPGLRKLVKAGTIERLTRGFRKGDLKGARLAIAATDDVEVNARVAEEARALGVMVNVVDDPPLCEFIVPSVLRRGDVTVAVSTGGKSPALARKIRTDLENRLRPGYGQLALMISDVRARVKQAGMKLEGDAWQRVLDVEALCDLLEQGKEAEARSKLLADLSAASSRNLGNRSNG